MRKKNRNILIGIVLVAVALFLVYHFNGNKFPFATGTTGVYVRSLSTTNTSFLCEFDSCRVYGFMGVTTPSTQQVCSACQENRNALVIQYGASNVYSCEQSLCPHPTVSCFKGCTSGNVYSATFNFNPSNDDYFPYSDQGNLNVATSTTPKNFTTDYAYLSFGQSVSFIPLNGDKTPVILKLIYADLYDNSCQRQIDLYDGSACDKSEPYVLCKPVTSVCSSGYTFKSSSTYCNYLDGVYIGAYKTNICDDGMTDHDCKTPTSDYTRYSSCSSSQNIPPNNIQCGAYSSSVIPDSQGRKCFTKASGGTVLATSNVVGILKCDVNSCNPGTRTGSAGSTTFQECMSSGGCSVSMNPRNCPNNPYQLVFDGNRKCIFSQTNHCNKAGDTQCDSSGKVKTCISLSTNGIDGEVVTDLQWSNFSSCNGEQTCSGSSCSCTTVDRCTKNSIKCSTDGKTYSVCNLGDLFSCLDYRGTNNVDTTNFQTCIHNELSCVKDSYTASSTDTLKCTGNDVYQSIKHGVCYRWEFKETCTGNYACELGVCTPTFENIGIMTNRVDDSFAVNEKINNITVIVLGNNQQVPVKGILYENGVAIPGVGYAETMTDSGGRAVLNFNVVISRIATISIKVTVGNAPAQLTQEKTVYIKNTLEIKPTCYPTIGRVNRPVTCSWTVTDVMPPYTDITSESTIKWTLTQGGAEVPNTPEGLASFKFTPTSTSSLITLDMNATAENYIPSKVQLPISVLPLEVSYDTLLDNQPLSYYSTSGGISAGTHTVKLTFTESGLPLAIQNIQTYIVPPSGCPVPTDYTTCQPVIFSPDASTAGAYTLIYPFTLEGQSYSIMGKAFPSDPNKETQQISLTVTTTKTQTPDLLWLYITIGVSIGIVILVMVLAIVLSARRRR